MVPGLRANAVIVGKRDLVIARVEGGPRRRRVKQRQDEGDGRKPQRVRSIQMSARRLSL
jgi:hypothetical protein